MSANTSQIEARKLWGGGVAEVPEHIATCPECGSRLVAECIEFEAESGRPTDCGWYIDCVAYDETLQDEENGEEPNNVVMHRFRQSDWQLVFDCVHAWAVAAQPESED